MLSRITIVFIFTFSLMSVYAQKVGFVNSQEILSLMPELQEANSQLDVMKNMFSKKGEEMVQELRVKYQALQKKQASGEVAPVVLEKEAADLKAEESKIVEFEKSTQSKMYEKSEELLKPIRDKLTNAIKDVATENGYIYIFDQAAGVVLYADEAVNVAGLVKAKLGLKL